MHTPTRTILAALAFALLITTSTTTARQPDPATPTTTTSTTTTTPPQTLARATSLYEQALELRAAGDEPAARDRFNQSATLFQDLIQSHPGSASLHRNLALAHIHAGDLALGILNLRRAALLDPHNPTIRADLQTARARVQTRLARTPTTAATTTADPPFPTAPLPILHPLARPAILWTAIALLALAWAAILWRILAPHIPSASPLPRPSRTLTLTALTLATLALAAPIAALWSIQTSAADQAILIADDTTAHTGPSATAFPPAFDQPLQQGLELTIAEQRADWTAITLPNNQTAWIPTNTLQPLTPTN
ncbi:MAG: hypothetical protein ACTS3F_11135 [Phycisphaerales bacterium]